MRVSKRDLERMSYPDVTQIVFGDIILELDSSSVSSILDED